MLIVLLFSAGCIANDQTVEENSEEIVFAEKNPYSNNASALGEGKRIFKIKCTQCHGEKATGGAGPNLADNETIYGSADDATFRIIYYGTPNGMPTWKKELGSDKIWKVMAYMESLKK